MRDNFLSLEIRGQDRAWDSVEHICSGRWPLAAARKREPLKSQHTQPSSTAHYLASPAQFSVWSCGCAHACYQLRCRCSALAQSRYLCRPTPWFPGFLQSLQPHALFFPASFSTCADAPRWKMAAEWLGAEEAEDAGGSEGPQGRREQGFDPI